MTYKMKHFRWLFLTLFFGFSVGTKAQLPLASGTPNQKLLNEAVDISEDFRNFSNTYFIADSLTEFDPATEQGKVNFKMV